MIKDHSESRVFGFIHPVHDVHTLGIVSITQLLDECGIVCHIADREICTMAEEPGNPAAGRLLYSWISGTGINAVGFSYRLDPSDAVRLFGAFVDFLETANLTAHRGGPVRYLYFAGLPEACAVIKQRYPVVDAVFSGDETPSETLEMLGVPWTCMPSSLVHGAVYDEARRQFARELVRKREYLGVGSVDRRQSPGYGCRGESVVKRALYGAARGLPPLMRAHVGPYLPRRKEAVDLFLDWTRTLASGGLLDILSIGTSQLSQSRFGEDWRDAPDGGGVPINDPGEFEAVWRAARPMFVRTYAGTKNVPALARMYEERLDIAWHALSFWWFCRLDGRGDNSIRQNLEEHFATMRYIASTGKPLEPNVPHHFAFRGADDVSYIVSGYIAAKAAKLSGIRTLILQIMLNTPKSTWGVQDLAKARVLLRLVRGLEDASFRVFVQPRGGLDYFSPDPERARIQLAEVTALMDDIEPHDDTSPQIIHVVSYSEGFRLADPSVVEESVRITRHALSEYRRMRKNGSVDDMATNPEVATRQEFLMSEATMMIGAIESTIPDPYTPCGMYEILSRGFFALPYLSECRDEFGRACSLKTRLIAGSIRVVDEYGQPIGAAERIARIAGGPIWKGNQ